MSPSAKPPCRTASHGMLTALCGDFLKSRLNYPHPKTASPKRRAGSLTASPAHRLSLRSRARNRPNLADHISVRPSDDGVAVAELATLRHSECKGNVQESGHRLGLSADHSGKFIFFRKARNYEQAHATLLRLERSGPRQGRVAARRLLGSGPRERCPRASLPRRSGN